jgi:hypothetical protein
MMTIDDELFIAHKQAKITKKTTTITGWDMCN